MTAILKNGPCNGELVNVPDNSMQHSMRVAGCHVVYKDTGEVDPETGHQILAYQPPKPKPAGDSAKPGPEDDDDDE
jgi:hypothetical protein